MATELLSPKSVSQEPEELRRYSSEDLAQSCNISVKEAEQFVAASEINFDQNGTLDINQFQQLKQQIMARSVLFSNSFNTYYDEDSKKDRIDTEHDKFDITSDHGINTNNYNDRFDSDKASIDTNDLHRDMDFLKHKPEKSNNINTKTRPIKILLNGSPVGNNNNNNKPNRSQYIIKPKIKPLTNDYNKTNTSINNPNQREKTQGTEGKQSKPSLPYQQVRVTRPKNNNKNKKFDIKIDHGINTNNYSQNNNNPKPQSPVGINPIINRDKDKSFNIMPKRVRKVKHDWSLGVKYDWKDACIKINVADKVTKRKWRRFIKTCDVTDGDIKREYFHLGKLLAYGTTSYSEPHKGNNNVQITIKWKNEIYTILVNPI